MRRAVPWLACALLGACGGTTRSTPSDDSTSGASFGASTSTAGRAASGGSEAIGGASARAGAGGNAPDPSAGSGGKVPDFPGGASFGDLACDAPYAGPSGGPRVDGPPDLGSCQGIPDEAVLARYKNHDARSPQGLYFERDQSIAFWNEPCSMSVDETVARGPTDGMGTLLATYTTEWFYEAAYCYNGSLRRVERNLRCDYFDGHRLGGGATPERLAFLGSLLWWSGLYNVEGSVLLGHSITIGDATDVVELCDISAVYGDFGLCDEVRLQSTKHRLMADGTVALGVPTVIRTLKGECH